MNIQVIAEHSVDLDLLPEKANILDAGCRRFEFTNEMIRRGHAVYPIDIDDKLEGNYYRYGLTCFDGITGISRNKDPQATCLSRDHAETVEAITLKSFSDKVNIPFWDLIKLDIEGSEYDVIMSLDKAPATQLSIEFHLHTGIYDQKTIENMEIHLWSLGYSSVQHKRERRHGLSENYWDSLFILKQ